MELTMQDLETCFLKAEEYQCLYIGVRIKMKGFKEPELIITPSDNFNKKLEYYKKEFNDDLILKNDKNIKIVGFTYGDYLDNIEADLIY